MGICIRNARAEQLARELVTLSGESLTQAIILALEERLEQLKARRAAATLTQQILRISQTCSALPDLGPSNPDEILNYDSRGIPKR